MREFFKQNWHIILLELLVLMAFCLYYGSFGDINIDSFREAYIPQKMLEGEVLYKNIFCIYPPLAYFINSVLFLIFGTKLGVIYFAGLLTTLGIVFFTYKISEFFLNKNYAFITGLLFISAFILSPNAFNPFFPYSYGLLYGLFFILCSVYFCLKEKFPLSYLFYSLAICSKYEFIFLLPVLIFAARKTDRKINLAALLIPPFVILSVLFIQGIHFENLITSLGLVKLMGKTTTLHWFYSGMGLIFRPETLLIYLESFFKFFVPYRFIYQEFLIWAFPVITILFVLRYKDLGVKERVFVSASILLSLKVFFALTLQSYGVFFLPFALVSILILLPDKLKKIISVYFLIWCLIIGFNNSKSLSNKNFRIKTENGIIKTNELYGKPYLEAINYFKNIPSGSKVLVYPEGLGVNFLSGKDSDSKFYSLIPLYVEIFGDELITKRLEMIHPEYIAITNYNTSAYYYERFGYDYAGGVYKYINKNYALQKTFGNDFIIFVYKKTTKK